MSWLRGLFRRCFAKRGVIRVRVYKGAHMEMPQESFAAFSAAFEGGRHAETPINIRANITKIDMRYLILRPDQWPSDVDANLVVPCQREGQFRDWHQAPAARNDIMWTSVRERIGLSRRDMSDL